MLKKYEEHIVVLIDIFDFTVDLDVKLHDVQNQTKFLNTTVFV